MATSRRRRPPAQPAWTPGAGIADAAGRAPDGDPDDTGRHASGADRASTASAAGAAAGQPCAGIAGPAGDALAAIGAATGTLAGLLAGGQIPTADVAGLAEALHAAAVRIQGAHLAAVGAVRAAAAAGDPSALPPGPATAAAWLSGSHRLTPAAAAGIGRDADWLAEHPATAAALRAGDITAAHVTVLRQVSTRTPERRAAFDGAEDLFVELARRADPAVLRRALAAWADNIDPLPADGDAEDAHARRRVFLTPVADGWDLSGYLPGPIGAELSGILSAFMDPTRHTGPEDPDNDAGPGGGSPGAGGRGPGAGGAERVPARARRADALLEAARAAAAAVLPAAARTRAAVVVALPGHRLGPRTHVPGCPAESRDGRRAPSPSASGTVGTVGRGNAAGANSAAGQPRAACPACAAAAAAAEALAALAAGPGAPRPERLGPTWAVGNGPGTGNLAASETAWLSCDATLTRLVLDPASRPLDLGRTTRTIPTHLRRALDARDGGCIIPGCDRPPGWCEAHHITHWADGGDTAIDNLALTCSKHHHELHLGHWHITIHDGLPHARHIPTHRRKAHRERQHQAHPAAA